MKNILYVLPAMLVLSSCATTWTRPETTQDQYQKDNYACERDMRQSGYFGTGLVGVVNMQDFNDKCMASKGYTKVQN
jgi:hypothetical protein